MVLLRTGMTLTEIANKLNMSSQALNSIFNGSDVRSGFIEKCVDRLGMSYNDFYHYNSSMHDNYGAAFGGKVGSITNTPEGNDSKYIELLASYSGQLTKAQEQIDRLISVLENRK